MIFDYFRNGAIFEGPCQLHLFTEGNMQEQVLVVGEKYVWEDLVFDNGWAEYNQNTLKYLLNCSFFMDRPDAEKNPKFKQLIPYCTIKQGNEYYCYKRTKKGGDKRLHDMWSLGCGGHINSIHKDCDGNELYWGSLQRELEEEIGISLKESSELIVNNKIKSMGFIYDESNLVGQVHLGISHIVELPELRDLTITDGALSNGGFETVENIKKNLELFETWSQILINKGIL